MYVVKTGDEPFKGLEIGFWENKEDAIECAKRFMKRTEMELEWKQKEEGIWLTGCYWIHVTEVEKGVDLF